MVPDYLKYFAPESACPAEQTVICEDVKISVITSRMLRIEKGVFTDDATQTVINRSFTSCTFSHSVIDGVLTLVTDHLELKYSLGKELEDGLVIRSLGDAEFCWHFGEKPRHNLGGTVSTLDNIDGSCEIDDGILSRDGFTFFDDSGSALFAQNGWFVPRDENTLDVYFLGYGHDYELCIKDFYRLTGSPEMLPAFALGNWWSRYHKYTDEEYLSLMDNFAGHDIPLSVGIVDMDWHLTDGDGREYWTDGWTGYTWNEKLFPDYRSFIAKLHDRGLKTALNLHPHLGVRKHEAQYEAMAKALNTDISDGKPIGFDCLDPEFMKAYFEVLHFPYEDNGVDFWWMDWQQGKDYSWIHSLGGETDPLERSITPLWMLNHTHYLASQRGGKRGFIFSRFAGFGSQRYPIGFSGDTVISWESLDFQPRFTATASNIGYSWWSHDIGGHMGGIRDDELTARWIQFGVFSPILRLHSTSSPFASREPWNYNKRAELVMSDFMRLRHRLFPYIYTMNYMNAHKLLPLMRPMYHVNPSEDGAYCVPNQYWFGTQLVAAPITSPADKESDLASVKVWLPEGKWVDFFNGFVYSGGEHTCHRRIESMPLFIKAGGIVPMQEHLSGSNKLGQAQTLEIVIAAGADGSFTLYEDDGESLAYKCGSFATTEFKLDWSDNSCSFTIKPTQGDLSLVPAKRTYRLRFIGFGEGACSADAFEYDRNTACYEVTVCKQAAVSLTVTLENCGGLISRNGDWYGRVFDLVLRAQHKNEQKELYMDKVHKSIAKHSVCESDFEISRETNLGGAIYELMSQAGL